MIELFVAGVLRPSWRFPAFFRLSSGSVSRRRHVWSSLLVRALVLAVGLLTMTIKSHLCRFPVSTRPSCFALPHLPVCSSSGSLLGFALEGLMSFRRAPARCYVGSKRPGWSLSPHASSCLWTRLAVRHILRCKRVVIMPDAVLALHVQPSAREQYYSRLAANIGSLSVPGIRLTMRRCTRGVHIVMLIPGSGTWYFCSTTLLLCPPLLCLCCSNRGVCGLFPRSRFVSASFLARPAVAPGGLAGTVPTPLGGRFICGWVL